MRERHQKPRKHLLDYSIDKYGDKFVHDVRTLLRILVLYLPLPLFWSLFDQKASRWIFQAEKMNGDLGFYTIKPDQMLMTNPLLVIILIPVFETIVVPAMNKIGLESKLNKIVVGGFLIAIAFLLATIVQFQIESSPIKSVNILWQLPQYFIITVGEVMFSPVGLAFSYEQAPESMKSTVQGFWQLNNGLGNLITLIVVANFKFSNSQSYEFLLFSVVMFINVFIFMILARNYKKNLR